MRLIKRGAEADLYLEDWYGRNVVVKRRVAKPYRIKHLDEKIRGYRTVHEAQIMHEAKKFSVPTPTIYMVSRADSTIVMEYVEGVRLKEALGQIPRALMLKVCRTVGLQIGKLHRNSIMHGDLTTSNMIQTRDGEIFFIDFGLSQHSTELEDRGVDLHLMKRALNSTHHRHAIECFKAVMDGYESEVGSEASGKALSKVMEIERRGRYFVKQQASS